MAGPRRVVLHAGNAAPASRFGRRPAGDASGPGAGTGTGFEREEAWARDTDPRMAGPSPPRRVTPGGDGPGAGRGGPRAAAPPGGLACGGGAGGAAAEAPVGRLLRP